MPEQRKIAVVEIGPDAEQPRKHFDEGGQLALGQNMLAVGQLVPVIAYVLAGLKRFALLDGERRWRAAQLVGIKELDAIVLSERPTTTALRLLQMSVEAHRVGLSAMERSDFLTRIRQENNWSVSELADALHMKQPLVSKLLAFQKLCPDIRKLVHAGELDTEKAYVVSQEPDAAKQRDLAKQALTTSRDQLRHRDNAGSKAQVKTAAATFVMPGGMRVIVQGSEVTLTVAIDLLEKTVVQLKKGRKQGLDITTQQRVMRDTAKAGR